MLNWEIPGSFKWSIKMRWTKCSRTRNWGFQWLEKIAFKFRICSESLTSHLFSKSHAKSVLPHFYSKAFTTPSLSFFHYVVSWFVLWLKKNICFLMKINEYIISIVMVPSQKLKVPTANWLKYNCPTYNWNAFPNLSPYEGVLKLSRPHIICHVLWKYYHPV